MRHLFLGLPLIAALPSQAETLCAEVGRPGIAATEARLPALAGPTDAERFALGGVLDLRAFEVNFEERRKTGLTQIEEILGPSFIDASIQRPPFWSDNTVLRSIFQQVASTMSLARDVFAAIPANSGFALQVELAVLWFDVNENATREPDEGLVDILHAEEGRPSDLPQTVRFDVADAAFLASEADLYSKCDSILDSPQGIPDGNDRHPRGTRAYRRGAPALRPPCIRQS